MQGASGGPRFARPPARTAASAFARGYLCQADPGREPRGSRGPHSGGDGSVKWLDETHGTKFELVRHFLTRMLDGEWSSAPGQWRSVVVGAFALLFSAGVLLVREGSLYPASPRQYFPLFIPSSPEALRAA